MEFPLSRFRYVEVDEKSEDIAFVGYSCYGQEHRYKLQQQWMVTNKEYVLPCFNPEDSINDEYFFEWRDIEIAP